MNATKKILLARRRLEEIPNLEIMEDLQWDDVSKQWYLLIKIAIINTNGSKIPKESMWYIACPYDYPNGEINIYPAIKDGITTTFNHQDNNGIECSNKLWRSGKLCLKSPYDSILVEQTEPQNYEEKLFWNAKRAVEWTQKAAMGELIKENDFYEIPDFIVKKPYYIISNEDSVSMMEWEDVDENYGYVDFFSAGNAQYYVGDYTDVHGKISKTTKWGSYVNDKWDKIKGAWILLKKEPILNIWQAPNTFRELKEAFNQQNVNFQSVLEKLIPGFRDGKQHVLMVGFPIPEKIGGVMQIIHWESILLPVLSCGKNYANGFRNNELGWRKRDFQKFFKDEDQLEWLITQNWNSRAILSRGHFENSLTRKKVLLIGAGTLGAHVGEQLVRGGVTNITIMDDDIYKIGNAGRHILSVESVGKYKAKELTKFYNCINPNVNAKSICESLNSTNTEQLKNFDLIIDCSADNSVLNLLSEYESVVEKIYISISFGYKANMFFFTYQKSKKFNIDQYIAEFKDKLVENQKDILEKKLPWEGIGCWHPVFPAMSSDVQLIASFATNIMKEMIEKNIRGNKFYVYERKYDEEGVLKEFVRV